MGGGVAAGSSPGSTEYTESSSDIRIGLKLFRNCFCPDPFGNWQRSRVMWPQLMFRFPEQPSLAKLMIILLKSKTAPRSRKTESDKRRGVEPGMM